MTTNKEHIEKLEAEFLEVCEGIQRTEEDSCGTKAKLQGLEDSMCEILGLLSNAQLHPAMPPDSRQIPPLEWAYISGPN